MTERAKLARHRTPLNRSQSAGFWVRSSRGLLALGFFGGNFALFSLWLPEQFETRVRATAFAFCTSFGRFVGACVNFLLGAAVPHTHALVYRLR
jgi:hypothetical protein